MHICIFTVRCSRGRELDSGTIMGLLEKVHDSVDQQWLNVELFSLLLELTSNSISFSTSLFPPFVTLLSLLTSHHPIPEGAPSRVSIVWVCLCLCETMIK